MTCILCCFSNWEIQKPIINQRHVGSRPADLLDRSEIHACMQSGSMEKPNLELGVANGQSSVAIPSEGARQT
ncbi:hypothetical protein ACTXT7_016593, partial [Hymenolepis weldensis]